MPCLIADSGPLIALAKLGLLNLPARLFGRVVLPETVWLECTADGALPDAQALRRAVEAGDLEVMADLPAPPGLDLPRLDEGELAVLALAGHLGAVVLMDERRGRQAALRLGLAVVGVCGLLLRAKHLGWLGPLKPLLETLRSRGYYISPALAEQVLARAGER